MRTRIIPRSILLAVIAMLVIGWSSSTALAQHGGGGGHVSSGGHLSSGGHGVIHHGGHGVIHHGGHHPSHFVHHAGLHFYTSRSS